MRRSFDLGHTLTHRTLAVVRYIVLYCSLRVLAHATPFLMWAAPVAEDTADALAWHPQLRTRLVVASLVLEQLLIGVACPLGWAAFPHYMRHSIEDSYMDVVYHGVVRPLLAWVSRVAPVVALLKAGGGIA